jgi:hypothetical protein
VPNIFLAEETGCDLVTVPHDILGKAAKMYGVDLTRLSLDTVRMFAKDAADAGYQLGIFVFKQHLSCNRRLAAGKIHPETTAITWRSTRREERWRGRQH